MPSVATQGTCVAGGKSSALHWSFGAEGAFSVIRKMCRATDVDCFADTSSALFSQTNLISRFRILSFLFHVIYSVTLLNLFIPTVSTLFPSPNLRSKQYVPKAHPPINCPGHRPLLPMHSIPQKRGLSPPPNPNLRRPRMPLGRFSRMFRRRMSLIRRIHLRIHF